ncbi:MAG: DUF996 domain-containing protein [Nitrososphaerota archaeon]
MRGLRGLPLTRAARWMGLAGTLMGAAGVPLVFLAPQAVRVVWVLGPAMLLLAVLLISHAARDLSIFWNMSISWIILAAGWLLLILTVGEAVQAAARRGDLSAFGASLLLMMVFAWPIIIASAWFLRRSFAGISLRMGAYRFAVAATWYWYGALLLIVLVGALLMLVGLAHQVLAFWELPDELEPQPPVLRPVATRPVA